MIKEYVESRIAWLESLFKEKNWHGEYHSGLYIAYLDILVRLEELNGIKEMGCDVSEDKIVRLHSEGA